METLRMIEANGIWHMEVNSIAKGPQGRELQMDISHKK